MRFKLLLLLLLPIVAYALPGFHPPWGKDADIKYLPEEAAAKDDSKRDSLVVRAARQIILFHQQVLSPVDGPRSHFRPSSSGYMLQAIEKYGFIKGFCMGCDRLMRENSATWVYPKIEENGQIFKYDPVP